MRRHTSTWQPTGPAHSPSGGGPAPWPATWQRPPQPMLQHRFRRRSPSPTDLSGRASVAPRQTENVGAEVVQDHLLAQRGDAQQPRLTEVPGDVVLLRVAHSAVRLQCAVGCLEPGVGAEVFRRVRLTTTGLPVVVEPGRLAQNQLRRIEPGQRVSEGKLDALVHADRTTEDLALVAVPDCASQRGATRPSASAATSMRSGFRPSRMYLNPSPSSPTRSSTGMCRSSMKSSLEEIAFRPIFLMGRM